jgi:hypothetical protein
MLIVFVLSKIENGWHFADIYRIVGPTRKYKHQKATGIGLEFNSFEYRGGQTSLRRRGPFHPAVGVVITSNLRGTEHYVPNLLSAVADQRKYVLPSLTHNEHVLVQGLGISGVDPEDTRVAILRK